MFAKVECGVHVKMRREKRMLFSEIHGNREIEYIS